MGHTERPLEVQLPGACHAQTRGSAEGDCSRARGAMLMIARHSVPGQARTELVERPAGTMVTGNEGRSGDQWVVSFPSVRPCLPALG